MSPTPQIFQAFNRIETDRINCDVVIDKGGQFINFGEINQFFGGTFPNDLMRLVNDSHTASATIDTKTDFIQGSGFEDPKHGDLVINIHDETLNELHAKLSADKGLFWGCYVKVIYNGTANEPTSYEHVPFEMIRLSPPDTVGIISKVVFNRNWGTPEYKKKESITYPVFNPDPKIVAEQKVRHAKDNISFPGQIMPIFTKRPGQRFYPIAPYVSAQEWMEVDAGSGRFHASNQRNNFLLSTIFKVIGDPNLLLMTPDQFDRDENGNPTEKRIRWTTVGQDFAKQMEGDFAGVDAQTQTMVLWALTKEGFPEVQEFPQQANDELFIALAELATSAITIGTQIPPMLANIQVPGKLGGSDELASAVGFAHGKCVKLQMTLETGYKKLFANAAENKILQGVNGIEPTIKPFEFIDVRKEETREENRNKETVTEPDTTKDDAPE